MSVLAKEIWEVLYRNGFIRAGGTGGNDNPIEASKKGAVLHIDQKLSGVREAVEKIANYTDWTKEPYTVENVEALRKEAETLKIDNVPEGN